MIKNIFLASLFCSVITGCNVMRSPAILNSNALEYSKYSNSGFLFTESPSVNFEYSPIATLSVINRSGYSLANNGGKKIMDDVMGVQINKGAISTTSNYIPASRENILEELYKKATELGANAIINLRITYIPADDQLNQNAGYIGDGMAIKK